jgi:hypothetical protein
VRALDLAIVAGGAALSAGLAWYFFGPMKARQAEVVGQLQDLRVTVRGAVMFSPGERAAATPAGGLAGSAAAD